MGHCCGTLLWDSLPAPQILRVLKLYYKVASSQLVELCAQSFARARIKSRSRLRLAHSTRTISAEGCARTATYRALACIWRTRRARSPQRVGRRARRTNRTLACISRTRHARSPQRVAPRMGQIGRAAASRALDTHDLRRGLRVKSPKRAFRTRLPQKLTRQSL